MTGRTANTTRQTPRLAAFQRGYFTHAEQSCASAGTIALTVIAGPLNYVGVNPKVTDCNVPRPS